MIAIEKNSNLTGIPVEVDNELLWTSQAVMNIVDKRVFKYAIFTSLSVAQALITNLSSPHLQGHPRLVSALAKLYSPLIGQEIDPMTNTLVSVGAYGALFSTIQGLINPGDEVSLVPGQVQIDVRF